MDAQEMIFGPDANAAFLEQAKDHEVLGPHYFAGTKIAEAFMRQFEADQFEPLVAEFHKKFTDKVWTSFLDFLLADTESNLQSAIWHRIEYSVEALLTGQHWALERYVTNKKYQDGERIREAIARLIPREVMDKRITDLENENKQLRERLEVLRR